MRRAVEKLSWLVFSLVLSSVVAFAALARLSDVVSGRRVDVPLLVNLEPRNARDLALAAARDVARGGPDRERGAAELARLGGAALPHVLAALDALDPVARGHVALALVPVALRMGVVEAGELDTAERALVFWTRFWQDRSADFRRTVARRKVTRLADRALSLRQKEVVELDTFAVPELLDALGGVRGSNDVARVQRLAPILSHVTGNDWKLAKDASAEEAAELVSRLRAWGVEHRLDFTTLDGPGRVVAVVTETRYFRWLSSLLGARGHADELSARRAASTLRVATLSLAGAAACAALGLVLGAVVASRVARGRKQTAAAALLLVSVPTAWLALWVAPLGLPLVTLVIVLLTAAFVAHHASGEREGATLLQALWRGTLHSAPLLAASITALLAAEALRGGTGLGALVARALQAGDLDGLMLVALSIAVLGLFAATLGSASALFRSAADRKLPLGKPSRRRVALAISLASVPVGFSIAAPAVSETLGPAATALQAVLVASLLTMTVAGVVALVLGVLAGSAARSADLLLARAYEVSSALPIPLVAGALLTLGGMVGPVLFGLLRGVEAAFLLRAGLAEERRALDLEPISVGRTPLLPQLLRLLPRALHQPLSTVFSSGAWIASLASAALALGLPAPPRLLPLGAASGPAGSFVALATTLLGVALLLLLRPRAVEDDDTPGGPVVLALRRRISRPPPENAGGPPEEPAEAGTQVIAVPGATIRC